MPKRLAAVILAAAVLGPVTADRPAQAREARAAVTAPILPLPDSRLVRDALDAADAGDWERARLLAERLDDPLARKIVHWMDLVSPDSSVAFEALREFIEANPDWPDQWRLRRRAEESLRPDLPHETVRAWFKDRTPVTVDGQMRLAEALLAAGRDDEARRVVRDAWIEGDFGHQQERQFYRRHRKLLSYDDHVARLDRLLWEDRDHPARRMLWKVEGAERRLAEARIALMRNRGGVDAAIARVPDELREDPGLTYERLRWRRRKGRDLDARELLDPPPAQAVRPEKWWTERAILARRALEDGHISEAYRLAAGHRLDPDASAADFAEAEWLAGWIALRFLEEEETGLEHFQRMFRHVSYPISRARGAYWSARAAEAAGREDLALDWYRTAAQYPTVYYGQLAVARLRPGGPLHMPPAIRPTPAEAAAFEDHELVAAVRLMGAVGRGNLIGPFVMALDEARSTPGWRGLAADLAQTQGRPDLAVRIAKRALRDDNGFVAAAYPLLPVPDDVRPEPGLVLGVVRQESLFDPEARSPAGARGLMQLLPSTARSMATRLHVRFAPSRLTEDPELNVALGSAYLAKLVEDFDGSYLLAVAAYNAGPSRVRGWIREYGDPRDPTVDAVDWVETIPYPETRNYVQRVLENLQVYRVRLGKTELAHTLEADLKR